MFKWFRKLFKKKRKPPVSKPLVAIKSVALIVGHTQKDKGAVNYNGQIAEYDYWTSVVEYLGRINKDYFVTTRNRNGVRGACADAIAFFGKKPDAMIELHFNSYNGRAEGCEALYIGDRQLAEKFCDFMERKGRKNRGAKNVYDNGRGIKNLETMAKYSEHCTLAEAFFADNKQDYISIQKMAEYLTEFINEL